MRSWILHRGLLSLFMGMLAWLLLVGIAAAQDTVSTGLEILLVPEGKVGQEMTVAARLTDEAGAPIANAEVVFLEQVEFMNSEGDVRMGRAVTDENGVASLAFVPLSEGEMSVIAKASGDQQYASATATGTVPIQPGGPQYVEEAGVRIPGINVSLLVGVLGAVWGTYLVVMLLIFLIARDGLGLTQASEVSHE